MELLPTHAQASGLVVYQALDELTAQFSWSEPMAAAIGPSRAPSEDGFRRSPDYGCLPLPRDVANIGALNEPLGTDAYPFSVIWSRSALV